MSDQFGQIVDITAAGYTAPAYTVGAQQWFQGTVVPDANMGTDGDFYVRTLTGVIYQKISGVWTSIFTAFTLALTQTQSTVLAAPTGGNGVPSFRNLKVSDIEELSQPIGVFGTVVLDANSAGGLGYYFVGVDTSASVGAITLPDPLTFDTRTLVIKDTTGQANVRNITVSAPVGHTIDGVGSKVINTAYGSLRVFSQGSNWWVL
jgi:hypothetical protein